RGGPAGAWRQGGGREGMPAGRPGGTVATTVSWPEGSVGKAKIAVGVGTRMPPMNGRFAWLAPRMRCAVAFGRACESAKLTVEPAASEPVATRDGTPLVPA